MAFRLAVIGITLLLVLVGLHDMAQAATFTVTKTADTFDGFCDTDCSLREAVALANSGDRIDIPAGTYTLTLATQITVDNDLILAGAGATTTIIQAAANPVDATWRVFAITSGKNVTTSGVTIRYGNAPGDGGAIHNSGTLTLADSTISDNTSLIRGGGIYNNGGTLTLTNSTISDNKTRRESGGEIGGGIANVGGTLTLTNSTISGNRTWNFGAGIYNTGAATLTNSTVSDNVVWKGAGIYNASPGALTLTNSTVSGNSVTDAGGGIWNSGSVSLVNTILAANTTTNSGPDCSSSITSQGHNFIGSLSGCSFTKASGDITGTVDFPLDPKLGPLQDNGGPTLTHALLVGSPAIDAGDDAAAPTTDQRGVARPLGAATDIGAFELGIFADLAVSKSVDHSSPRVDETLTFTVTVTNNGPGPASGVVVNDLIPSGLTLQSATPSAGAYSTGTGNWTLASWLASGASATLTMKASVDAGTADSTLINTASVTASDQTDLDDGNDSDSTAVTVRATPQPIPSVGSWGFVIIATAFAVIVARRSSSRAMRV